MNKFCAIRKALTPQLQLQGNWTPLSFTTHKHLYPSTVQGNPAQKTGDKMRCLSHISSHTCWKVQAYTHSRISQLDCLGDLRHPPPLTPTYTKLASTYYTFRNSLITGSTTVSLLTQKSPQLTLQIQLNPQASESQMPLAQREQRKQPCAPQTL